MLRLGHIDYSNCIPVHARLLAQAPRWLEVRRGVPAELNAQLAARLIDVAPCSSIEYARHPEYRVLPGLMIGSRGPVESILLESRRPVHALDGCTVAVPTASATSVVLLRILLETRWQMRVRYRWFEQETVDAVTEGADAALWIGDVALRREFPAGHHVLDLGAAWSEWTGLPFAFALWQTAAAPERDPELAELHRLMLESLDAFPASADELARQHAPALRLEPARLARYWRRLDYRLDDAAVQGALRYYELAAELGEVPGVPAFRWVGGCAGHPTR